MGRDRPAHAARGHYRAAAEELANARRRAGAEPESPPRGNQDRAKRRGSGMSIVGTNQHRVTKP